MHFFCKAIKIVDKVLLKKKKVFLKDRISNQYENVVRELEILKKLDHPNVLRLIQVIDDPKYAKLFISKKI